jgi:hypothetical protein
VEKFSELPDEGALPKRLGNVVESTGKLPRRRKIAFSPPKMSPIQSQKVLRKKSSKIPQKMLRKKSSKIPQKMLRKKSQGTSPKKSPNQSQGTSKKESPLGSVKEAVIHESPIKHAGTPRYSSPTDSSDNKGYLLLEPRRSTRLSNDSRNKSRIIPQNSVIQAIGF